MSVGVLYVHTDSGFDTVEYCAVEFHGSMFNGSLMVFFSMLVLRRLANMFVASEQWCLNDGDVCRHVLQIQYLSIIHILLSCSLIFPRNSISPFLTAR